ncbi:MAG: hypothetical protein KDE31_19910, partial [Caldilineaceae bacterium]|nr:hypothetical protein [Caldilineaceae bacterium]
MAAFFAIRPSQWVNNAIVLSIVGAISILMTALFAWQTPGNRQFQLDVGQVAPYDIVAPAPIVYESAILTEKARERAAQSVADQFDSSEGRVRRQQKNRAREILDFISIVRRDPYLSAELQTDYLRAIDDLKLTAEEAFQIQELAEEEWAAVVNETPGALDRIMAEEIRENTVASARRRLTSLIDTDLSEEVSTITIRLAGALIRPNSIYNPTRTEEMKEAARNAVPAQLHSFARGETIIRAGDVATAEDVEALTQLGLLQSDWDWWHVLRASVMTILVITTAIGSIYRLRPSTLLNHQELAAMAAIVVLWLLAAKFMIIIHDWVPYLYPLAAMSMLVTVLIDLRIAVILIIAFSLTVNYLSNNNILMVSYATLGALAGALILGRAERLSSFLWAGLGVAL